MDNLLTTEEKAGVKPYLFELLDQKKEEGREEGREEGIENTIRLFLIKNPNWTDQQIVECFEVTIEFVSKIRAK
jgi:predicted transposase YdaD